MKLLIVEDDLNIIEGLSNLLETNNYDVDTAMNYEDAIKMVSKNDYDLIILDITLPDGNGFDLYQEIKSKIYAKVIFLSALDDENDIVNGLELGADDYITKPFLPRELLARINKIALRIQGNDLIKVKDITFNVSKMIVLKNEEVVSLSSLELKILNILFMNMNKVVTRDYIIEKIWDWTGNDVNDNTISVYLKRIREKLDNDIIKTIKGIGYRIDEE